MENALATFIKEAEAIQKELDKNPNSKDRDYLAGKLVAYAEVISELKAKE